MNLPTIHNVGIRPVYPDFNDELKPLDAAIAKGRWKNVCLDKY